MSRCVYFLLLLPIIYDHPVFSQTSSSSFSLNPDSGAVARYHQSAGDQWGIYNGTAYLRYPYYINRGHVFFLEDSFFIGSVLYDGIKYTGVPLLHDEVNDELLTPDIRRENIIRLVTRKVDHFSILDHHFIRIGQKDQRGLAPGFYQSLYNEKSGLLRKEVKVIHTKIVRQTEIEREVTEKVNYYLRLENKYEEITGYRSFLSLFGPKRRQVQSHMRSQRIRYKKNKEKYIITAVRYYDEITR
jgi:hypothetical protein